MKEITTIPQLIDYCYLRDDSCLLMHDKAIDMLTCYSDVDFSPCLAEKFRTAFQRKIRICFPVTEFGIFYTNLDEFIPGTLERAIHGVINMMVDKIELFNFSRRFQIAVHRDGIYLHKPQSDSRPLYILDTDALLHRLAVCQPKYEFTDGYSERGYERSFYDIDGVQVVRTMQLCEFSEGAMLEIETTIRRRMHNQVYHG